MIHFPSRKIGVFFENNWRASRRFVEKKGERDFWFRDHLFRPSANICIDERVQDFADALGLPTGILEAYRAGGSKSSLASLSYARRTLEGVSRLSGNGNGGKTMVEMRMVTAHESRAFPNSHSCAAWNHKTSDAIVAMQKHAAELNLAFPGRMVAFVVLIDTDLDAITLIGPDGGCRSAHSILAEDLLRRARPDLREELELIFPPRWKPLAALEASFQRAFHVELGERVLANIEYVRKTQGRPPELLDHHGELIFVGRHADWITEHNSLFLIDDTEERRDVLDYFALSLRYVARNVIRRAIDEHKDDWTVPVVVNIPHDGDHDERVTQIYAHKLREDLEMRADEVAENTASWILHGKHAIEAAEIPDKVFRQVHNLRERIVFATSISLREDRLFRPFEGLPD